MSHAARDKVLSTVELLEFILLQLDMCTLLSSAQLVNHHWNELITQNFRLQEALFFKAEVSRIRPSHTFAKLSQKDKVKRIEEKRANPLLAKLLPPLFPTLDPEVNLQSINQPDIKDLPIWKKPGRREAFFRPDASWRRMYTHQPPLESMGLIKLTHAMRTDYLSQKIARCNGNDDSTKCPSQGTCMAALYDTIHSILRESKACFIVPIHQITSKQKKDCLKDVCSDTSSKGVASVFKRAAAESEFLICSRWTMSCVVIAGVWDEWREDFSSKDEDHYGSRAKGRGLDKWIIWRGFGMW